RPLAYVAETDLERWAAQRGFPIIPCNLCGGQPNLQRAQIKQMLRDWERSFPGRTDNMAAAMGRVTPSHLMDRNLYPFVTLQASGQPDADGDKAFDDDETCATDTAGPQPLRLVRSSAAGGPEVADDETLANRESAGGRDGRRRHTMHTPLGTSLHTHRRTLAAGALAVLAAA